MGFGLRKREMGIPIFLGKQGEERSASCTTDGKSHKAKKESTFSKMMGSFRLKLLSNEQRQGKTKSSYVKLKTVKRKKPLKDNKSNNGNHILELSAFSTQDENSKNIQRSIRTVSTVGVETESDCDDSFTFQSDWSRISPRKESMWDTTENHLGIAEGISDSMCLPNCESFDTLWSNDAFSKVEMKRDLQIVKCFENFDFVEHNVNSSKNGSMGRKISGVCSSEEWEEQSLFNISVNEWGEKTLNTSLYSVYHTAQIHSEDIQDDILSYSSSEESSTIAPIFWSSNLCKKVKEGQEGDFDGDTLCFSSDDSSCATLFSYDIGYPSIVTKYDPFEHRSESSLILFQADTFADDDDDNEHNVGTDDHYQAQQIRDSIDVDILRIDQLIDEMQTFWDDVYDEVEKICGNKPAAAAAAVVESQSPWVKPEIHIRHTVCWLIWSQM